jgi:glutathione reductase (NADPH)
MQAMLDQGINVQTNLTVSAVQQSNTGLSIEAGEQSYEVDSLLWAIGRSANTGSLGLDQTAIRLDAAGHIETDAYQNTSVPGIYAVGDVTGQAELTPVAIAAGRRLADRLFNDMPDRCVDYRNIPTVVFTHPPVASIGLTESDARAQFGAQVKVYNSAFTPLENALTTQKIQSSMKLVVSGAEEKIVGCHVFGPGADEMMQGFAVAIRMGACKRDFDDTIAIHPTSAEELVTMR